jgi:CobQ-like glutamine amidotransferase family enzyme
MTITLLHLFPEDLGASGDSGNVQTVAYRLRERGFDVKVSTYSSGDGLGDKPGAVFIGSGPWAAAQRALDALAPVRSTLRDWFSAGVPFFAVGTGAEILARTITLRDGHEISGLDLFPFTVVRDRDRLVAYNDCDSRLGRIVAFSDLSSEWRCDDTAEPLGHGVIGGKRVARNDGVICASSIATQLGGPVLALNPHIADWVAERIVERAGGAFDATPLPTDSLAENARAVILDNMDQVFTTIAL